MLMATLKGLKNNKTNFKQGCKDEYIRMYKKIGEKNLLNSYFINNDYLNSLEKLSKQDNNQNNQDINDSMVISRILPIGMLFWQKENRKKLIVEIIENISLTHKNTTLYLSAITLGLFISYKKHNINKDLWPSKLTEYLLSSEFDLILKELKLYSTEFILEKEDYITTWNEYLNSRLYKNRNDLMYNIHNLTSYSRANTLFLHFNEYNSEEFVYGLKADQAIIIAYDSLLYSTSSWEKMVIQGILGITDNSVMGMLSGILFGIEYGLNSINIDQFRNEGWLKKILALGKELDFN
jgi:ADP-ribosylglycohydrolase